MADNRVQMPVTGAGITRFSDEFKSRIAFQPEHVIIFGVIIMVLVIFMHLFGAQFLGL